MGRSEHAFIVNIPNGKQISGNITKPTGVLSGITYNLSKTIAARYTLTGTDRRMAYGQLYSVFL